MQFLISQNHFTLCDKSLNDDSCFFMLEGDVMTERN